MNSTELIIKIDMFYFLGIMGSLIAVVWFAGTKWGKVENSIEWIKEEMGNIWSTIKERQLHKAGVAGAGSPMNPTELGRKYLNESGLEKIIDEEKKEELKRLKSLGYM